MWIVYKRTDSWEHGIEVADEGEARELCAEDEELTYIYVDQDVFTYL